MAANLYPAQTGPFVISDQWCDADDDDQDTAFTSADSAILTVNSADPVTVDEAWAGVAIYATGASGLAFGSQTITFSGNITLDDITATVGAATISADNFDVGTNGSLKFTDDAQITADIALDGGTIDDDGNDVEVIGSFIRTSGTLTSTGEWTFSGTGDLKNADYNYPFSELVISGTMTNTAWVYTRKVTITGTINGGTNDLVIFGGYAGWWGLQTGVLNCDVWTFKTINAPGNAVTLNNRQLQVTTNATEAMTMDAAINTGTGALVVYGDGAGDSMTLNMNGHALICGAIQIGPNEANSGQGILTLGDGCIATIASVTRGNDANDTNGLNLDNGTVLLSGILDGDNQGTYGITVTSVGANIHNSGGSGEIKEVTSDNVIHCWGLIDGGDNGPNVCHESSLGGPAVNVGCGLAVAA